MLEFRRDKEIFAEQGAGSTPAGTSPSTTSATRSRWASALRVFNDDRIIAGAQWPMHPHRDIESLLAAAVGGVTHAIDTGEHLAVLPL